MTAINYADLERELIAVEGLKLKPYRCTAGKLSIGIGRNLEDRGITEAEARVMFRTDVDAIERELDRAIPWWRSLSAGRRRALINMGFMGVPRLLGFKNMLAALQAGESDRAAAEPATANGRATSSRPVLRWSASCWWRVDHGYSRYPRRTIGIGEKAAE